MSFPVQNMAQEKAKSLAALKLKRCFLHLVRPEKTPLAHPSLRMSPRFSERQMGAGACFLSRSASGVQMCLSSPLQRLFQDDYLKDVCCSQAGPVP